MSKYPIIQLFCWLTFLKRGPIPNFGEKPSKNNRWLTNAYFISSVLTLCFVTYYATMGFLYSDRVGVGAIPIPPGLRSPSTPNPDTNTEQEELSWNGTYGTANEPSDNPGPGWVVRFTLGTQYFNIVSGNLMIRILTLCNFPVILRIVQKIGKLKRETKYKSQWKYSFGWSQSEISYVVIVIISVIIREFIVLEDTQEMLDQHSWSFIKGSLNGIDQDSGLNTLKIIDAIILQVGSYIGGSLVLEFAGFLLLNFVTFVTRNLKIDHTLETESSNNEQNHNHPAIFSREITGNWIQDFQYNADHDVGKLTTYGKLPYSRAPKKSVCDSHNMNLKEFMLPDSRLRNDKILFYTKRYFQWYLFWNEFQGIIGLVALILFFNSTVELCDSFFIAITSSLDNGITNRLSWGSSVGVLLIVCKMLCFGNTDYQLQLACNTVAETFLEYKCDATDRTFEVGKKIRDEESHYAYKRCIQDKIIMNVLDFIKKSPINISALGFFKVSRSTLTNMVGVIFTYLIILLQFYSSQRPTLVPN